MMKYQVSCKWCGKWGLCLLRIGTFCKITFTVLLLSGIQFDGPKDQSGEIIKFVSSATVLFQSTKKKNVEDNFS